MEFIQQLTQYFTQHRHEILQYLKFTGILVFGFLLLSSMIRFLLGKKAQINRAVSTAVEILCLYVINIVVCSLGLTYEIFLSPLPFVSISGDYLHIFPILQADFAVICDQMLKILIIAFFVNILNDIIPEGKHIITWYLLRLLTVVLAVAANYAIDLLLHTFLPQGFTNIAPLILLLSLVALILLGSLKLLTGVVLVFLNPLVSALYTFFFSNFIGRQLARAIVSTALLTALVVLLNVLEISVVYIAASVLTGFIPLLIILFVLWYIIGHIL